MASGGGLNFFPSLVRVKTSSGVLLIDACGIASARAPRAAGPASPWASRGTRPSAESVSSGPVARVTGSLTSTCDGTSVSLAPLG